MYLFFLEKKKEEKPNMAFILRRKAKNTRIALKDIKQEHNLSKWI